MMETCKHGDEISGTVKGTLYFGYSRYRFYVRSHFCAVIFIHSFIH